MNFLLLERHEVAADGQVTLSGRRAEHVRQVLRAAVGQTLRAILLDAGIGTATVAAIDDAGVRLHCTWPAAAPAAAPVPAGDALLLAVPRPKVLLRMLAHAAALGFARIVLFRSWRVEKSHLGSEAMRAEVQRDHLLAGLEQSGRWRLPEVRFFPLFKPMVEDHLDGLGLPPSRFVAHPSAATRTCQLALAASAPFALALGPDGGFLPYEVEALHGRGFLPVSCGDHALRTETALAALTGQLALLRERASFAP